ncbi:alpha/beta hydrolase [Ketobacter sp. MCCC 1A13808]|nr:alpha/beta hydrolase [Ketobacter sp. MCCC 1A13808]RLP54838.1 MAG: alpha/beta hydrolase [Ketobacter sp.]
MMLGSISRFAAIAGFTVISSTAFSYNAPGTGGAGGGYDSNGPYATTTTSASGCSIYRPRNLGEGGMKHPIILWGNGTGTTPSGYSALLSHWASHGFVVAAASTTNAASGEEMLSCLDYLQQQNSGSGTFAGKLDLGHVGSSGHSQGGGGSIMVGRDARIKATAPMQPYTLPFLGHNTSANGAQNGPMLLMSGSADTIAAPAQNQDNVFRAANVPVFHATAQGASHFEAGYTGGAFQGPSTAWFKLHLMDDQEARSMFYGADCTLCTSSSWSVKKKNMD